ncbi:MAG: SDR family oxidoreductase [Acidobacteriota bacterium]
MLPGPAMGMGAAIARELKARGYNLVLMSRTEDHVMQLAGELDVTGVAGSVTETGDLQKTVDAAMEEYGRIDAVVNSTGHCAKGELLALTDEDWHSGLELVMLNVIRLARLVTPVMLEQGGGSFVNISTFAAYEPSPDFPVSSAIRAALGSFTKLFTDRYAADNIRMNNILPGYIDSYEIDKTVIETIPMKRRGTVEEIAQTAAFLVSPGAGYITGQNIRVDGGLTRSV